MKKIFVIIVVLLSLGLGNTVYSQNDDTSCEETRRKPFKALGGANNGFGPGDDMWCPDGEWEKVELANEDNFDKFFRHNYPAEVALQVLEIKVSAIAFLPDGREIVVKNFETPPAQIIYENAQVKIDTSNLELDILIMGVADIKTFDGKNMILLRCPYTLQKKGQMFPISQCWSSVILAPIVQR